MPCLALRVTYVGELGYELYCPTEYGLALWDALMAAGEPHGLVPAGYRAIDSMRLEKGYRAWSTDITPETTPEAAGLGFAVRMDKASPFVGRDALLAEQAAGGPTSGCAASRSKTRGRSAWAGSPCGSIARPRAASPRAATATASSASIAYAYLPADAVPGATVEIDIFGELVDGHGRRGAAVRPRERAHQGLTAVNPNNSLAAA